MSVRPETTARHLRSRKAEQQQLAEARAARFREALPRARELLTSRFGATRLWLFGSLALGAFDLDSDVDLAVEGVPAVEHMAALAELMTLFRGPVDLVRIEEAQASLRDRILQEGREL